MEVARWAGPMLETSTILNTDSGASLGDILGAALRGRQAAAKTDDDQK